MNKVKDILVEAKKKGYYADKNGDIYSPWKKLKLNNSQNRLNFGIRYYGQREKIFVHRFIAYLKYGDEMFKNGIEVRHLDNNSLNNKWDNISIGTHSENMMNMGVNDRINKGIKASSSIRRFSDDEVQQILKDRELGMKYKDLCGKYNTNNSTLNYLFNHSYYGGTKVIS